MGQALNMKDETMRVETQRLLIDEIKETDRTDYFNNISHDTNVLKTFICNYCESLDDFDFNKYLGRNDLFAIRLKETGSLIGVFVECEVDKENASLEIGYGIGTPYWNRGYVTEVVKAMIDYYFTQTPFKTVFASFFTGNNASKRVMEKAGMVYSHTNLKELEYQGEERDLVYYKIEK